MPGIGDGSYGALISLAVQGLAGGGLIGILAFLFGSFDSRMKKRKDVHDEERQEDQDLQAERKALTEDQRKFQQDLISERDLARKGLREAEARCDQCEMEKDRVWFAARRMEGVAHDIRHEGNNRLMAMALEVGRPTPEKLPPVPALQSLLPKPEPAPAAE